MTALLPPTTPATRRRQPQPPRVREEDGAVYVEGVGYVSELPSYGSREAARKAAQEAMRK